MWDGKRRFDTIKIINLVTKKELILFDNPGDTGFVLESLDFGEVGGNTALISNVGQTGFDKLNTYLNTRDVTITGWVYVSGNYNTQLYASDYEYIRYLRESKLNHLVNPMHDLRLEFKEYYLEVTPTSSIQYGKSYQTENNEVMCKFMIQAIAAIPLWRYLERQPFSQAARLPVKLFPGVIPINGTGGEGLGYIFGKVDVAGGLKIKNVGDVPSGFIITITNANAVENPTIFAYWGNSVDTATEVYKVKFVLTLYEGQKLIINTEYGNESAQVVNADGSVVIDNALLVMTADSELPIFGVGDNIIEVFEDETGAIEPTFVVEYTPMFLEVW